MRKQSKILSLMLALSLLLVVFFALPAFADEDLTFTATEEEIAHNDEYVITPAIIDTTVEGNLYATQNGGSKLNNSDNLKTYLVTDSRGNTFLKLVPTATGATSGNTYFTTESLQYLEGTPTALTEGFIVYDFDLGTYSEVIGSMKVRPVFEKPDGSSHFASASTLSEIVTNPAYHNEKVWIDGNWNHITLVICLTSNEYRIYRNSERVAVGYINDAKNAGFTFKGVRFDIDEGATVSEDTSVLLDNISCRVYPASDDGVWVKSGYIYNWAGDVSKIRTPGKLPVISDTPVFTPSASYEELANSDEKAATPAIIDASIENNLYITQHSGSKLNSSDHLKMYKVTDHKTGNTYLKIVPTFTGTTTNNAYFSTESLKYLEGTPTALTEGFIVYDFDLATESEVIGAMNIQPVFEKQGGSSSYPSAKSLAEIVGNADYSGNLTWNNETWNHITIVINISESEYRIYRNSERIAVAYINDAVGAGYTFRGVRFDLNGGSEVSENQSVLLDNISCRVYAADDDEVWAKSGYISGWYDDINQMREAAQLPAVATVNGTTLYRVADLAAALGEAGREQTVEILRDINATIVVNTPAVVETHGLNVTLTAGDAFTGTTEGTVTTFVKTDNFTPSAVEELLANNEEYVATPIIIDTAVEGNLYATQNGGSKLNSSDHLKMYKVTDTETGNTYLKIVPTLTGTTTDNAYFSTESLQYLEGNPTALTEGFIVYDFDLGTFSEVIGAMKVQPVFQKPNGESYYTHARTLSEIVNNQAYHKEYVWNHGEWNHITIVMNLTNNEIRIYRNSERVAVSYMNDAKGAGYIFKGIRFDLEGGSEVSKDQSILLDNISCRVYSASDDAVYSKSGYITNWAGDVAKIRTPGKLPPIAKVGEENAYTLDGLNALLAEGDDVNVEFLRDFKGTVVTGRAGVFTTHGIADVAIKNTPTVIGGKVVSGSLVSSTERNVVTVARLTEETLDTYAVATTWVFDAANTETIYFLEGDQITYIGNTTPKTNYIEDGKLYNALYWADSTGAEVVDFGTATKGQSYTFTVAYDVVDTDITIKGDLKYNLSLYTNFNVNLYVPADKATLTGQTVTLGEAQYVVVTKSVAAPAVAEGAVFEVTFTVDGVEYTEKVTVNVVDYAVAVLGGEYSHKIKRVMITALEYANEACKLLNGAANDAITAVLENPAYAEFHVDANTNYGTTDNSALAGVISGANLVLESEVKILLKVADGFNGTITVNYNDYKGAAQTEQVFEVAAGDVIELNVKVYNLGCEFVIATEGVSGTYSLGAYIKGLVEQGVNADFAQALFTYAKTAETYKLALNAAE